MKPIESVEGTRQHSSEDAPPSSKIVRSQPLHERPVRAGAGVSPLYSLELDPEWDEIASDRDPPSLRNPMLLPDTAAPKTATEPTKTDVAWPRPEPDERFPDASDVSGTHDVTAAMHSAAATSDAETDDAAEPADMPVTSDVAAEAEVRAIAPEPTRPRQPKPLDGTPSIVIREPAPVLDDISTAVPLDRYRAFPWIGGGVAALAVLGATWFVHRAPPSRGGVPTARAPQVSTTPVAGSNGVAAAPTKATPAAEGEPIAAAARPEGNPTGDPPLAEATADGVVTTTAARALARSTSREASPAAFATTRAPQPDQSKIEAIAAEVKLASDDDGEAAPPTTTDPSANGDDARPTPPGSAPAIPPAVANARVAREHTQEIRSCYDRAARKSAGLPGGVTLHAVLDEHGAVTQVWTSPIPNGAQLSSCIAENARRWHFPERPGVSRTSFKYTFVFE